MKEFWIELAPILYAIGKPLSVKERLVRRWKFKERVPRLYAKYGVPDDPPDWDLAVNPRPVKRPDVKREKA